MFFPNNRDVRLTSLPSCVHVVLFACLCIIQKSLCKLSNIVTNVLRWLKHQHFQVTFPYKRSSIWCLHSSNMQWLWRRFSGWISVRFHWLFSPFIFGELFPCVFIFRPKILFKNLLNIWSSDIYTHSNGAASPTIHPSYESRLNAFPCINYFILLAWTSSLTPPRYNGYLLRRSTTINSFESAKLALFWFSLVFELLIISLNNQYYSTAFPGHLRSRLSYYYHH